VLRHADFEAHTATAPAAPPAELSPETRSTLRDVADPDLRASLDSLARALSGSTGPPRIR
jgi:hypothetical protein